MVKANARGMAAAKALYAAVECEDTYAAWASSGLSTAEASKSRWIRIEAESGQAGADPIGGPLGGQAKATSAINGTRASAGGQETGIAAQ